MFQIKFQFNIGIVSNEKNTNHEQVYFQVYWSQEICEFLADVRFGDRTKFSYRQSAKVWLKHSKICCKIMKTVEI